MSQFFTDVELGEAVFHLLASSGISRYAKYALQLSEPLAKEFRERPDLVFEAKSRALQLYQTIAENTERSEEEFELSILVAALSRVRSADWLLRTVASSDVPCMTWPSALAKRLLKGSEMRLSKAIDAWPRGEITLGELELAVFNAIVADPRASTVAETIAAVPADIHADVEESIRMYVGKNARNVERIQSLCVSQDWAPPARDYNAEQRAIEAIEEWAR